ncbi:MAG: NAD(P)H-dependent oxidoreductase [Phycisphaerales bacterium]
MQPTTPEALLEQLRWRYAVKKFDPARSVPEKTWAAIEQATILAPSSFGLQPFRMVVITDPAVKAKLPALSWNQGQPRDCSHMVVFAARTGVDKSDVDAYISRISKVRGVPVDHPDLTTFSATMVNTINGFTPDAANVWCSRQCYIALGFLLSACAALRVDACPMEGIQRDGFDALLGLPARGYRTTVAAAVGYRAPDDWLAPLPKVRMDAAEMVTRM